MRTFVIGDIHGAHRALLQCLQRSGFSYTEDRLICLGDIGDGWPETKQSVDELLRIKNLVFVMGNHDWMVLNWIESGNVNPVWFTQGGKATIDSYSGTAPHEHYPFFHNAQKYFRIGDSIFVHAGIEPALPIEKQSFETLLWDRKLVAKALSLYSTSGEIKLTRYKEVYTGHTPIPYLHPVHAGGVWMMDTGAGWSGVLSIMDIETKEYWTSDTVPSLYPGVEGRRKF